ncbi:hypothetical protein [Magnetospirillum aberrantis]|uniref:Uncharacterized protein n=1 Tax=Magnetospirillum aberrantis SpK TaxID=908842 RepID=A0A7C9QVU4_9PROT|nr:hypothetical protein [Magnetospirillum aberrantis]NFV81860.1 hypothetical protein [Magnetospirillum aberrantis SpK]
MVDTEKLVICGQELTRAFDFLDRANDCVWPSAPQLATKRGLLDAARLAVDAAKQALPH